MSSNRLNFESEFEKVFWLQLGQQLRKHRREIRITQSELAAVIDRRASTVSDFERGARRLDAYQIGKMHAYLDGLIRAPEVG